jgi:hypothetical protein
VYLSWSATRSRLPLLFIAAGRSGSFPSLRRSPAAVIAMSRAKRKVVKKATDDKDRWQINIEKTDMNEDVSE